jgi:phosphoribosyl-ATP pyrophosphohydrolase/phosphoribosyl-AMP cyclohydrolase
LNIKEIKDVDGIDFGPSGLVPAIAQDAATLDVLMLAYMDREALQKTLSTGRAHYYSRSRKALWLKGETSGNFQDVGSILYDCDADAVLLMVAPRGPACHTGERSCFFRALKGDAPAMRGGPRVIGELYGVIRARFGADPAGSYVASLHAKGLRGILDKVEEEAAELVEAASGKGGVEVVRETADLWFHTLVLLAERGIGVEDVFAELSRRSGTSGIKEKESRGKK